MVVVRTSGPYLVSRAGRRLFHLVVVITVQKNSFPRLPEQYLADSRARGGLVTDHEEVSGIPH